MVLNTVSLNNIALAYGHRLTALNTLKLVLKLDTNVSEEHKASILWAEGRCNMFLENIVI